MAITVEEIGKNHGAASREIIRLRVERVEAEADGVVAVVTLSAVDGGRLPAWTPGAHIDVLLPTGLERQYSLCGADAEGPWRLGILREAESRGGSEYLHTQVRAGDVLEVRGPRNNFPLVESEDYLFVAGGIGITPFLPMLAELERRGARWSLIYGGRSRSGMAFLEELRRYGDRVTVWPQDESGIIDVAAVVGRVGAGTVVYCCGPEPLIDAMEKATAGFPDGTLRVERFRPREEPPGDRTAFDVRLEYSQVTVRVEADRSIAEAVEAAGVGVITSCREGTCGTCETAVLEGIPDHRDSYLSAGERATNETIMICCSRSRTPRLVLDL